MISPFGLLTFAPESRVVTWRNIPRSTSAMGPERYRASGRSRSGSPTPDDVEHLLLDAPTSPCLSVRRWHLLDDFRRLRELIG